MNRARCRAVVLVAAALAASPPLVVAPAAAVAATTPRATTMTPGGRPSQCPDGLLADLQTVVPKHLGIQNQQKAEMLRFTNGVANLGEGDFRMAPVTDPGSGEIVSAQQEILDADGNVVCAEEVGEFIFHPEHNHWHIADVALYEVRIALDDGHGGSYGDVVANVHDFANSVKTTFCLIDWYQLDSNSNKNERVYWDCSAGLQGIQSGWVDQYHHSLPDQNIDLTGVAAGVYYLLSTANPDGDYAESDYTNNSAWVSFRLQRGGGNPKLIEIDHSTCSSPGMCGEQALNR
jgi:hypothetical protein